MGAVTALPHATRTPRPNERKLTRAAGWLAVAFGVIHVVVSPLDNRDVWSEIFEQGPWRTISLDVTSENLAYSEAFWVAPGSFGVPVLLFGAFVLWTAKQGARVPAPFGWAMTAWGAVLAALLPASPAWALVAVGVLLVLAARGPGAERPGTAGS
ncbi:hypothetical protein SMD44_01063 [Streptomyces alboflavus]|uniref:Uncharacterized protein n=1 Tax=Streptomyces alboflavus TaxID=67267 RepID=A0A1Z1W5G3_9ACTN|nr:DUF6463 family protein [Streptomyces alboflavus]ARX81665.1 hypothetical protein SMD44_01063 [Streptomyces alboflavus]